jgi:signal recognition particle receptor subunit beta
MAKLSSDETAVNARILYWGIGGSGKTANLESIHRKLRADHRGEIQREATLIDPTVEYESLAIELGEVGGLKTRIQMIAVPGGADQAPTRKQLLDQVDGVVLVIDSRRDRIDENVSSLNELSEMLHDYGRSLEDVPLVLQYNKRDLSDPYAIEELYRKLKVNGAAVFEAVATETTGVLQTLSTLSKHVVRSLRGRQFSAQPTATPQPDDSLSGLSVHAEPVEAPVVEAAEVAPEPAVAEVSTTARMEDAILSEQEHPDASILDEIAATAQTALDISWGEHPAESEPVASVELDAEFSIASVGEATRSGERGVRVPLVVSDKAGRRSKLVLSIRLDPLVDGESG